MAVTFAPFPVITPAFVICASVILTIRCTVAEETAGALAHKRYTFQFICNQNVFIRETRKNPNGFTLVCISLIWTVLTFA